MPFCSKFRLCLILPIMVYSGLVLSQDYNDDRFKGELSGGLNLSQMEGDGLSGFNKIGLSGGFRVNYDLSQNKGISFSIFLDQRGSAEGIFSGNSQHLNLTYFAFPISYYFGNWWHEESQNHKILIHFGFIPAALVSVESDLRDFEENPDLYRNWDWSVFFGIGYALGNKGRLNLKLERSLVQSYRRSQDSVYSALQNYLLGIRYSHRIN